MMENHKENIDKLLIKIKVLESKIQKIESQADEVIHDVKAEFSQQLKELQLKKEEARLNLLKISDADDFV